MPKLRAKVDANQDLIVGALRAAGATVVSLAPVGKGCPDLLIGFAGDTYCFEVKGKGKHLNLWQEAFHKAWRGDPIRVVRTVQDALNVLGVE